MAGDDLLKAVAKMLSDTTRYPDFVARYGGEEFALILPQTDSKGVSEMASRLREAVEEYGKQSGSGTTISIGVASYPQSSILDKPEDLINQADQALYAAKATGKNKVMEWGENLPAKLDQSSKVDVSPTS